MEVCLSALSITVSRLFPRRTTKTARNRKAKNWGGITAAAAGCSGLMALSMLERKARAYDGGAWRGQEPCPRAGLDSAGHRRVTTSRRKQWKPRPSLDTASMRNMNSFDVSALFQSSIAITLIHHRINQGWQDERNPFRPLAAQPQKLTERGKERCDGRADRGRAGASNSRVGRVAWCVLQRSTCQTLKRRAVLFCQRAQCS